MDFFNPANTTNLLYNKKIAYVTHPTTVFCVLESPSFQLFITILFKQLELQRQQLINERQQFYKELIKVKHGGVINFPPPPTAEMIPGNASGAHPPAAGPTPPQHGAAPASGPPPHPGAPPPSGPPNYPPQHPYQPNTQVTQVV